MRSAACLAVMLFLLSACGGDPFWLPRAHKISIQQGNLLNEQQLAQVTVGMNKQQVSSLIGTPVEKTPFRLRVHACAGWLGGQGAPCIHHF